MPEINLGVVSKAVFLLSVGLVLIESQRGKITPHNTAAQIVLGFLILTFLGEFTLAIQNLCMLLGALITQKQGPQNVSSLLSELYDETLKNSQNLPEAGLLIWRTGIWAVAKSITEFFYLSSGFILEAAEQVVSKIILFFLPLCAGFYPISPKFALGGILFFTESCLWIPMLRLIELVSYPVLKGALIKQGSLGIPVIATEIVSVVLCLSVPVVTHRLLQGALSGEIIKINPFSVITRTGSALGGGA